MGIYFFYGDEDYLIDKEILKHKSKLDANFSAMNYVVHDSLSFPELTNVLRSQPMMFGKMIIVINTHKLMSEANKRTSLLSVSLEDQQLKEIESALDGNVQNFNDSLDIFFVEKYEKDDKKKKPDTRRKIFKILSKYNTKEFSSIPVYKVNELTAVINDMAKDRGLKILADASGLLIDNKGNNLREFELELDKLLIFAYPEKTITKSMVAEICDSNQDLFNLTDFILAQNYGRAILELRKLLETNYPLKILATLQTILKKWIYIKLYSGKKSYKDIGQKVGMHEYVVQKTLEKMKNVKLKSLVDLKLNITNAEYRIKTGQALKPEEELENAIIK